MFYGLRKQDTPAPRRAPAEPSCPLCGAQVYYQGLTALECTGEFVLEGGTKHCPNFFYKGVSPEPGTRRWARILSHRKGLVLELRVTYPGGESGAWVASNPWQVIEHEGYTYEWRIKP